MYFKNYDNTINYEIKVRIAKAFWGDDFCDQVNKIPVEMRPRSGVQATRCCIYRDRAIIKYRCMASLGFPIEGETDELKPLSEYARQALERTRVESSTLTFVDEACNGCVRTHYEATNACQGCLIQACIQVCPKDAIQMKKGKSAIDPDLCIKCGKCVTACPYHAIVYIPVPCEAACPTGAISKNESGKEEIDYEKCIFCGKCMSQCPFSAVLEKSQIIDVLKAVKAREPLVAMVAPAIAGEFSASMPQIASALKAFGFTDVAEVSTGADITAQKEADEFIERQEEGAPFMTSSCCPAYTILVQKHLHKLKAYVSDTRTPMHYTAKQVKETDPKYKTVFIGPCVAKRREGAQDEYVDYVLTFQELAALFAARQIDLKAQPDSEYMFPAMQEGKSFPVTGGVTKGIVSMIGDRAQVNPVQINGLDSTSIKQLKRFAEKGCDGNFVEVMGCAGGCVAGPSGTASAKRSARKCEAYAKASPSMKDLPEK